MALRIGNLGNGHGLQGVAVAGIDAIHGNAAIIDGAVVAIVIIDDGGLVEKLIHAMWFGAVIARMTFRKTICGNEGETIRAQTEIKANGHARTAVEKARARAIHRERRQRCPSAIVIVGTPRYP